MMATRRAMLLGATALSFVASSPPAARAAGSIDFDVASPMPPPEWALPDGRGAVVCVGVGDGPWDVMEAFDDRIPERAWDNFQFLPFSETLHRAAQGVPPGASPAMPAPPAIERLFDPLPFGRVDHAHQLAAVDLAEQLDRCAPGLTLKERFTYAQAPVDTRTDTQVQEFLDWTSSHALTGKAGSSERGKQSGNLAVFRCGIAAARGVYRQIGLDVVRAGERAWDERVVVSGRMKAMRALEGGLMALRSALVERLIKPPQRPALWSKI